MEENINNFDPKTESSPPEIRYVRPLDRSPDKGFHSMTDQQKKITCHSRALKTKIYNKINRLENEIEQREKEVDVERKLRQEAEDKLNHCYQDMYKSKDVNQELRERLPRANKSDPFKSEGQDVSETDLSSIEEQIIEEEDNQASSEPKMEASKSETVKSPVVRRKERRSSKSPKSSPRQSPKTSPKSSRRTLDFSPSNKVGMETQTGAPALPYSSLSPPIRGMYGSPYGANPYTGMMYPGGLQYPGMSPNYGSPLLHSSPLVPPPSLLQRLSPMRTSSLQERPMTQTLSVPTLASNPHPTSSTDSTPPTATTSAAAGSLLGAGASFGAGNSQLGATQLGTTPFTSPESGLGTSANLSAYYQQYFPTRGASPGTSVLPDPPFVPSTSPRLNLVPGSTVTPNQNNHISALLAEIDSQRQETRKLKSELQDKESELETLKLTFKVKGVEEKTEPTNSQQAADLVEEVYAAQKRRDEASTARMKICADERDDAMTRLRQLEARMDSQRDETSLLEDLSMDELRLDEDDDNEDMHFMLSQLDTPTSGGDHATSALMKKVEALRQRQREVTQEEMQIVMEQRDAALARCRKLEEELLRYQREADGGMDSSIKAKLASVQQERDLAVAKSKQLNDEIQTLRIYYSLHKSLATENSIEQPTHNTSVAGTEDVSAMKQELEAAQKENDRLSTQLRTATFDKKQLEQALESVSQDKERLQRLANVLKRKLNNLSQDDGANKQ